MRVRLDILNQAFEAIYRIQKLGVQLFIGEPHPGFAFAIFKAGNANY